MANTARNEVVIHFKDKDYTCRPTFECIAAIESATGKSIFVIGQEIYNSTAGLTTLTITLMHALRTSEDRAVMKLKAGEVGNELMMQQGGATSVFGSVAQFCLRAFAGPKDADEEQEDEDKGEEKDPSP